jgi:hypothetical protein
MLCSLYGKSLTATDLSEHALDMAAHRFTLLENNFVVDCGDVTQQMKAGIYGLEKLNTDNKTANEDIKRSVEN